MTNGLTANLCFAAMQHSASIFQHVEVTRDNVTGLLGINKDNGSLLVDKLQLPLQDAQLLIVLDHVDLHIKTYFVD